MLSLRTASSRRRDSSALRRASLSFCSNVSAAARASFAIFCRLAWGAAGASAAFGAPTATGLDVVLGALAGALGGALVARCSRLAILNSSSHRRWRILFSSPSRLAASVERWSIRSKASSFCRNSLSLNMVTRMATKESGFTQGE